MANAALMALVAVAMAATTAGATASTAEGTASAGASTGAMQGSAQLPSESVRARAPTGVPGAPRCPLLPADSVWNTPISTLPIDARSSAYVDAIGADAPLHPDFGKGDWDGGPMGIPFNVVNGSQPKVPVTFTYASESDPGPYPLPPGALVEGGPASTGDRHVIVVDSGNCKDYELWDAYPKAGGRSWHAGSGAVWDLRSDHLRPATWTSADAAGLPVLPGLVLASQDRSGSIRHAIRVTVPCTDERFIWPARHEAGGRDANCPPMGLRLRLKAGFDIARFPLMDRVILQALKTYGMIVADNGSPWYISGTGSNYWDNDVLHEITAIRGRDFEVVDESCLEVSPTSAKAALAHCPHAAPTPAR